MICTINVDDPTAPMIWGQDVSTAEAESLEQLGWSFEEETEDGGGGFWAHKWPRQKTARDRFMTHMAGLGITEDNIRGIEAATVAPEPDLRKWKKLDLGDEYVYGMFDDLVMNVDRHHALAGTAVLIMFKDAKLNQDPQSGTAELARTTKASSNFQWLLGVDWTITINHTFWLHADESVQRWLLDREMTRIGYDENKGNHYLRKPDVETFVEVQDRHGEGMEASARSLVDAINGNDGLDV